MYKCKHCNMTFENHWEVGGHSLHAHFPERIGSKKISKEVEIKYLENPRLCLNCNKIITYDKIKEDRRRKFCSQSCAAIYNNKDKKSKKYCLFCNKEVNFTYCNNTCRDLYKTKQNLEKNIKISSVCLKSYLIATRGYKCESCSLDKWLNKPITIELEHKDGNSENNTLENSCLLCPNCHSQTPTYKGKNIGNGRHSRRERYKAGLSY